MIQGADPDYVRKHLGAIDTALGAQSPGTPALSALIDQAERAVSTSQVTVDEQHVISQVVLRKFVENVRPNGNVLARVDLASGLIELAGTRGIGWVLNFVPVDGKRTEDLWQLIERDLNPAISAALNGAALASAFRVAIG